MTTARANGRRNQLHQLQQRDEEEEEESAAWYKFCSRLTLKNERPFTVPPFLALGSSLSELLFLLKLTGFLNLDMIALSSVCILVLLTLVSLLYVRFDKLTPLAFLVLSVSLLCSSTYLVVVISTIDETTSPLMAENDHNSSVLPGTAAARQLIIHHGASSSVNLHWIHEIQAEKQCCGYWNYTDWLMTLVNETSEDNSQLEWVTSCCNKNLTQDETECLSKSWTRGRGNMNNEEPFLFADGCGHHLDTKLQSVNDYKFRSSTSLLFWDLAILIDLVIYTLWKKFRSKILDNDMDFNDDVFT